MSSKKAIDKIEEALGCLLIADRKLRVYTAMKQASGVLIRGIETGSETTLEDGWCDKMDKMEAMAAELDEMVDKTNMPVTGTSLAIGKLEQALKLLKEEEQPCTSE